MLATKTLIPNEVTVRLEIIQKIKDSLLDNCTARHRIVCGGRGKGASWSIARILLTKGIERPLFIPCVREVQKSIKHSVKKLLADTIKANGLEFFYKVFETEIKGINGTLFTFHGLQDFNADNIKSLEGADMCWIAEAQCIARRSLSILRPTIRKDGVDPKDDAVIWYDINPRYETDPVYVDYIVNNDPNAKVCHLSWVDNPWFTRSLIMEKDADYLRDPIEAKHIWEGDLRDMGERFVCPPAFVDMAMKNNITKFRGDEELCVGADIAHQGGDKIVFYLRRGMKIIDSYKARYQTTVKTFADLKRFIPDTSIQVNIDNGHVGASVADMLENENYIVNRINFGVPPEDKQHYDDTATSMYFNLRDILLVADIPKDDELRGQLTQRKYKFIDSKRGYEVMRIESKKEFKEHAILCSKSPDEADALVLTYYDKMKSNVSIEPILHNIY